MKTIDHELISPRLKTPSKILFLTSVVVLAICIQSSLLAQSTTEDYAGENSKLIPRQLLSLVHAPEVHTELGLSSSQVAKLEKLFGEIDGYWFRARNLPADKQNKQLIALEGQFWKWSKANLDQKQQERLTQLEYRAQGVRMLLRKDLAEFLALKPTQTNKLVSLAQETNRVTEEMQKAMMKNAVTDVQKQAVLTANKAEADILKKLLTAEQFEKLSRALGQPFDTAKLKRIYPMAPELVPVQNWINSNPLTLKELRGKVVVLHFYAFQCHNCHANFGHYTKWHDEFGDDVVVLGIQTPETTRERDPSQVRAAAKERNLKFPIMVDLESKNWASWSNTMWPTVYVIDKNGYIRQWWQGELNWNGATGDQTIHGLISDLLDEEVSSAS